MRTFRVFGLLVLCAFSISWNGCSSSTNPPQSASLIVPASVDFGVIGWGRWHDTTYSVSNPSGDSITITAFHFSAPTVTGSKIQDTLDVLPLKLAAGKSLNLHVQIMAADSGSISVVDSIVYTAGGTTHTTTVSITANSKYSVPGSGSTFTFDNVTVDTDGIAGLHTISTDTIGPINISLGGKSNVTEVLGQLRDTSWLHIEANGDISRYIKIGAIPQLGVTVPPVWITVPFFSHTENDVTLYDDTAQIHAKGGLILPAHLKMTAACTYVDDENLQAAGQTFSTKQALIVTSIHITVFLPNGSTVDQDQIQSSSIWYSPKLSYQVKHVDVTQLAGSTRTSTTTGVLTGYSIK